MRVLLVNSGHALPDGTSEYLTARGFAVEVSSGYDRAMDRAQAAAFDAVVMPAPTDFAGSIAQSYERLLRAITVRGTAAIVLGGSPPTFSAEVNHLVDFASSQIGKEEIQGRLTILHRYHDVVRSMERDLDNMQRLFKQLNIRFAEMDQEMRLAGRLQSAFLPRDIQSLGALSFATLYRPATFVSGDIYDIYRVDEEHIAFYVADAVGHGMAAGLLTMFIKNAIISKKVYDRRYEVLDPNETLQLLNQKLCDQRLPSSQFVTACYGLFNTRTLKLQYARAGHPYPILCAANGAMTELKSPGGLLGLFEGEDFPMRTVSMTPGEKFILYSDGLELAFAEADDRPDGLCHYLNVFESLSDLSADRFISEFARQLDVEAGSLNPKDDVTMVVMQVNEPAK